MVSIRWSLLFILVCNWIMNVFARNPTFPVSNYNLVWNSPSVNSSGSMIAGNGEIGINLWVEEATGDVVFLISRTDCWSENGRLLKVGRVRINLDPSPFLQANNFAQVLMLNEGGIEISTDFAKMIVFVDANYPVIRVKLDAVKPVYMNVTSEIWRTERRLLPSEESFSAFGNCEQITVYPDDVYEGDNEKVIWYHRNVNNKIWADSLNNQGLGYMLNVLPDPILNRTFGAAITGSNLTKWNGTRMGSLRAHESYELEVFVHTNITATPDEWINEIESLAANDKGFNVAQPLHVAWWDAFWKRSWIQILPSSSALGETTANNLTQMYYLQRWMDACTGRGNYTIKFNGLIFTVDVMLDGFHSDPDYRAWGGGYWFQNTRQPYWPLFACGDFDMAMPLFKMYFNALPLAQERSKTFFGHPGIFWPETSYFFGSYTNVDYGCNRTGKPVWWVDSPWERYHYEGGVELLTLMLEYYFYTEDPSFLAEFIYPYADAVLDWWIYHYPPSLAGEIIITPGQAIETFQEAMNPLPDIAGLRWNLGILLQLPNLTSARNQTWSNLLAHLPPIPTVVDESGNTKLSPAQSYLSTISNSENPELYAIFPYRFYQVTKPNLDIGIYSYNNRRVQCNVGWCQDVQEAALLGLAEEAGKLVMERFFHPTNGFRFPTFWGQFFDWIPEEDHGATARLALQWMVTQPGDNGQILMFPAWPEGWDVDFKLHATQRTTLSGILKEGYLEDFNATPESRIDDIVWLNYGKK